MGAPPKIPDSFVAVMRNVVVEVRELGAPELKSMLMAEINARIRGTPLAAEYPNGITDWAYYHLLDRSDLYTDLTKPLEEDRLLWRHSENAKRQYQVWAELFVDAKLAVWNPDFREEDPYAEMIHWLPGAELHVASSDETDVTTDETARAKSPSLRSVLVAEPGSRRGHGSAGVGRNVADGRGSKRGWVKPNKERAKKPQRDSGESAAAKGGAKFTWVATDLMS
eukprot:7380074-Prymnesium_polylepis.2